MFTDICHAQFIDVVMLAGKTLAVTSFKSVKHCIYQSHPIGRGPDLTRGAFNIYGQSPLVAHFLRMRRLETDAGINFRVQRTQMENLPPLDTPTYRDLMRDSYKHVQQIEKKYERLAFFVSFMKSVVYPL